MCDQHHSVRGKDNSELVEDGVNASKGTCVLVKEMSVQVTKTSKRMKSDGREQTGNQGGRPTDEKD